MTREKLAVGIITAARPRSTLEDSLRSYFADGGFGGTPTVVSSDGLSGVDVSHLGVRVHARARPLGNFRNWIEALELALVTRTEYVIVCEDDVTWARGARATLEAELPQIFRDTRVGAASLYFPRHESRRLGRDLAPGWHLGAAAGKNTWGAQCLAFSSSRASALLADEQFQKFRGDPRWDRNVDGIVARCLNDRDLRIAYRVPCLVSHALGEGNSSLGYPDDRPGLGTDYWSPEAKLVLSTSPDGEDSVPAEPRIRVI